MTSPSLACLLDRGVALARAGGDLELLREIAGLFLENYGAWVEEIREAVMRRDAPALERTAHGLKSTVANFGAEVAVEALANWNISGRRRDLSEVAHVLNTLELALAALRPELESLQTQSK